MRSIAISCFLTFLLPILATSNPKAPPVITPQSLNITVLTANANKESILECWTLADLQVSTAPGTQGALIGKLAPGSALNYFHFPPRFDGGLHNAPVVQ